ncbi:MAG TPA: DUF2948 domain-containing protein [Rhodospirillaceae bacterium]|mgnify:CR=1 FL=1|nr:hypothetical protein [Rhodospirillaceae bacterium]HAA92582.1 DUF2948 domain-containing protein [Rhodospirillaceae bacterium]HAT35304.1 DUF2948 domain-containing protein [Rhodospirillaceae bacterium]|tara:strand:+ start:445 stop:876 length:432 start_codon:yes stop_codon:yes gene_type:complete
MSEGEETAPVRLRAQSLEDLSVISALLQDAVVPIGDIAYLREENSFVLVASRYCWECDGERTGMRVLAGLRFDQVRKAAFRDIDRKNRNQFLELLSVNFADGAVAMHFAGGGAIRLDVDDLTVALEDLDEPRPTTFQPSHEES